MILLLILGAAVAEVSSQCSQPRFKEDAIDKVQAGFKAIRRRGKISYDYRTIEIIYSPFIMVEDPNCIEESELNLELKSGSGDWIAIDEAAEALGGGKFKWSIAAVPCMDHMIKFWVSGAGGQASLEYPEPIHAVSEEELINSKFTPKAPTGLKVTHLGDHTIQISWEASECATSYELSFGKNIDSMTTELVPASDGNEFTISEGLEPCNEYDVLLFALVGSDEYSQDEASVRFTTSPDESSALSLEPVIESEANSVVAQWQAFDKLSCVDKYAVSVCKEQHECLETVEVSRNDNLETIKYESDNLDQCTSYTFQIQPLYNDIDLVPKIVDFRTKSPSVEGISSKLLPVSATAGDGQKITVSWSPVDCAEFYEVYQKVNSADGDWEVVYKTEESMAELNGVPCTEYSYGVQVSIDGVKSEIVEIPDTVMTQMDDSAPFVAPNLEIQPLPTGAVLTWDHGACISSYVIKTCPVVGEMICEEQTIIRDSSVHNITFVIGELKSCSGYTVEILPEITGKEFDPDHTEFRTQFPAPSPPQEFTAIYRIGINKVELEWSEVECASGYKIMQVIGDSETTTAWETDDPRQLFTKLDSPEPCVSYSYGVAAVVGGELSESTPMEEFSIPPKQGISNQPKLTILENINDTISLEVKPAPANRKCEVEVYELRYSSLKQDGVEEVQVKPDTLHQDQIHQIKFPGASGPGVNLEARIKYNGFDLYSPWIRSRDPTILSQEQPSGSSLLVPIVIGILVGIVVLVILIFFLIKRKRNQTKYDAEKATANKDETQKLNDHPDA